MINPDDVVVEHGADAFRLYEMFMGPLEQVKPWNLQGVEGVSRFLAKTWRIALSLNQEGEWEAGDKLTDGDAGESLLKIVHATIRKVGEDIEKLRFNTAISQMMECANAFTSAEKVPNALFRNLLVLLNPFAPHLTEELWERLGYPGSCLEERWPSYDEALLVEDELEMVVQVNGKVRARIMVAAGAAQDLVESGNDLSAAGLDLLPTLAHVAGTRPPGDRRIDGKNIWPILAGKAGAEAGHDAFYSYQMDQLQAVRSGPWKMFVPMKAKKRNWGKPEPAQPLKLFNLASDIHEDKNVAASHPDVVKRLKGLVEQARADLGDSGRPGKGQRQAGWVAKASPRLLESATP